MLHDRVKPFKVLIVLFMSLLSTSPVPKTREAPLLQIGINSLFLCHNKNTTKVAVLFILMPIDGV